MSAERDAWLAEMWPVCREVPREIRAGWAAIATMRNEELARSEEQQEPPEIRAA